MTKIKSLVLLVCVVFFMSFAFYGCNLKDGGFVMSKSDMQRVLNRVAEDLKARPEAVTAKLLSSKTTALAIESDDNLVDKFADFLKDDFVNSSDGYPFVVLPFYVGMAQYLIDSSKDLSPNKWFYDKLENGSENLNAYFMLDSTKDSITLSGYDEMNDWYISAVINYNFETDDYTIVSKETSHDNTQKDYVHMLMYAEKIGADYTEMLEGIVGLEDKDISNGIGKITWAKLFAYNKDGQGCNTYFDSNTERAKFANILINDCGVNFNNHERFLSIKSSANKNDKISEYYYKYIESLEQ